MYTLYCLIYSNGFTHEEHVPCRSTIKYTHVTPYHTRHFFTGFMGDPRGHLNASENSFRFDNGPIVLKKAMLLL